MFYFFEREREFICCELRAPAASQHAKPYEIHITYPDGREETERLHTSDEMLERWGELQNRFLGGGWWGPHGRD